MNAVAGSNVLWWKCVSVPNYPNFAAGIAVRLCDVNSNVRSWNNKIMEGGSACMTHHRSV